MSTEKYNIELSANALKLKQELDSATKELDKLKKGFKGADKEQGLLAEGAKRMGGAVKVAVGAIAAATVALVAYANVQGRAIRETEALATMSGLTVEEFRKQSFIMGTVGVTAEKYGDIMKDTQEKVGDFLASGGGAFQDFADVMKLTEQDALSLAKEFETMSGAQVLQAMVSQMENAKVSTQQMSFALEGMASDTTRLIPLLRDGGNQAQALGSKFDEINIELTEEEQTQFKLLAENVDLAQGAFVNFINHGLEPFLPMVNKAAVALMDLFAWSNETSKIGDLIDNHSLVENIDSLNQIEKLQIAVNKEIKLYSDLTTQFSKAGINADKYIDKVVPLREINGIIEARGALLKLEKEDSAKPIESVATESTKSGADTITDGKTLEGELEALQDAKKTKLQLLDEEKEERLKILEELYSGDAEKSEHYASLKKQVEQDYRLQILDFATTDEQAKQDAYANELASLRDLHDEKAISEEQYQKKLKEIIGEFAPSTLDPSLLEEENQVELKALQDKLDNKLLLHREYYEELAQLQKKDTKDKGDKVKTEDSWSKASLKTQISDGLSLINAVGGQSKKTHRIKQIAAASVAGMNTAEGITKALASQNYPGAALTAVTGLAQIAAIMSSSPEGGGSSTITPPSESPQPESFDDQGITATDISDGSQQSTSMIIEFSDETIDVMAKKVMQAQSDGRV